MIMYANIFSDLEIDERRMKKRIANNTSVQELVEEKAVILETAATSKSTPSAPKYSETRTTTVFTPGNNKMAQAMAVKEVADQFLMAS